MHDREKVVSWLEGLAEPDWLHHDTKTASDAIVNGERKERSTK